MSQPDVDYQPIPSHAMYLFVMCVCLTAAFVLLLADISGQLEFPRGLYSILTGSFVLSGVGYLVRSEGAHNRREICRWAGGETQSTGLDAEAIDSARTIARQLLNHRR